MAKEKLELEKRSYLYEVRAEMADGGAVIVGHPVVFDSRTDLGWFDEIIERGALDKTDMSDVRFLVNHDTSKIPLARSRKTVGNNTMTLRVDEYGLECRVNLDVENNGEARALYSAVERGDITGMSFMLSVDGEEWEDLDSEHPFRRVKSIASIVEVSACTFPAYEATSISARSKEALENARSAVETARQQRAAASEDVDKNSLALEKAKTIILGGI